MHIIQTTSSYSRSIIRARNYILYYCYYSRVCIRARSYLVALPYSERCQSPLRTSLRADTKDTPSIRERKQDIPFGDPSQKIICDNCNTTELNCSYIRIYYDARIASEKLPRSDTSSMALCRVKYCRGSMLRILCRGAGGQ